MTKDIMDEESALSYQTDLASGSLEEDDNELLAGEFLQRLDANDLRELRKHFLVKEPSDDSRTNSECTTKQTRAGRPLNKDEFIKAVDKIIGSTAYSLNASKVFQKLDFSQRGNICLEEVLDHIINLIGRRVEDSSTFDLIDTCVILQDTPHCKKETIVKVVSIETESSFCYAVLCKYGRVGVYDGTFQLHDSYLVRLGSGDADGENRRCAWLTDGVYLPDADALLLASSDRALHLFDASGLVHAPLCHVTGMRDTPQCMAYAAGRAGKPSFLFVGDDKGNVTTITFLQPRISLFKKKHPDKLDRYYWKEISAQHEWVTISVAHGVHQDGVRQIAYCPGNETLISCSQDPLTALVIRHVAGRRTPYIFKHLRGIRCFHLERALGMLATGSNDCVVRLWNPVVTKQPIVSLFGHKTAVVDVLVLRHVESIISCSTDGVIKVWDIEDQCCSQTLSLNFPSFAVLGKTIEFGTRSFYPGPSSGKPVVSSTPKDDISLRPTTPPSATVHTEDIRDHHSASGASVWERRQLLIVCCNHIAMLRVTANAMASESGATTPSLLPPPSREQHASVPSPWGQVEVTVSSSPASTKSQSTSPCPSGVRSSPSPRTGESLAVPAFGQPYNQPVEDVKDPDTLVERPRSRLSQGLNLRRVHHDRQLSEAKACIEQCAPHLALQLWDLEKIAFSRQLPVTTRMRERGIDVSDPEKLLKSRLHRDSTSFTASGTGSSSSSGNLSEQSSRSLPAKYGKLATPVCTKANKKTFRNNKINKLQK